jgi:predicted unusual protein kinase regulating ubiquinone biosynthesis (AarF/ABC1/UbiB family)
VPIAAASIGQVHRAITRDDVAVAVKVQYPGVDESIKADLDNYDFFANMFALMFPGADVGPFIDEIRERVGEELDYLHEADNQRMFADFYEGHPFIRIPRVIDELSTARVLTTELATGARFSELDGWSQEERNLAGETIDRFVFRSLYRLHAFNGDPHPGNYLFHGGGVVTFLDFGLVKRFTQPEMDMFERMAETLVVRRDGAAYRALLEEAGVLKPGSGMSDDQIVDYFGYYYDPVMEDREYTFTLEYASEAMKKIMPVGPGTSPEIRKFGNLPPAFGILQRINLGMTAVMAHLGATANWRRIGEELWVFTSGPPSTEMGEKEAAWLAGRTTRLQAEG